MSKISELSDGGALQSTDYLIAVRSGGNVKVQLSELPSGIGAGGNIVFGDNEKAIFGAGSDLQIYHDGSNSYVQDSGTGDLIVRANNLALQATSGEQYAAFVANGAASLFYDNSQKLSTTSTGIDVTGTVTADGLTVDGTATISGAATAGFVTPLLAKNPSTNAASSVKIGLDAGGTTWGEIGASYNTNDPYMAFFVRSGSEKVRITDAGNVGIGTSSPALSIGSVSGKVLHVAGAGTTGGRFQNTSGTSIELFAGTDAAINTGTSTNLLFKINDTEAMRLDSSGNLLVGTTSASYSSSGRGVAVLGGSASGLLGFQIGGAAKGYVGHFDTSMQVWNDANSPLLFATNATEAMRIDSSGALLVGTTDNNVGNNSGGTDVGIVLRDYGEFQASAASACAVLNRQSTDGDIAVFAKDGTTVGSIGTTSGRLYIGDGDVALRFADDLDFVAPWNASTNAARDAAIDLGNSGNRFKDLYLSGNAKLVADSAASAEIQLKQTGTGGRDYRISSTGSGYGSAGALIFYDATASSERARIDSSGNLFVGTTTTYPGVSGLGGNIKGMMSEGGGSLFLSRVDSNPVLYINRGGTDGDSVRFAKDAGSTVGSISVTASATAYNTSSDARLKENIADAEDAGAKVDAIQVRQFDWKADGSHQDYGMIAQELLTVAPEAVSGDPESDDMMGVDYSKLVPMLVKEIQSLRARVHALEGK